MKNLKNEHEVMVGYQLAEKLYRIGFVSGTEHCIIQYDSDFVYDGDPQHPESHRKGEIRVYNFYHKNNGEERNLFECPTIEHLVAWLLVVHHIYVNAVPTVNMKNSVHWEFEIMHIKDGHISKTRSGFYDSRTEALLTGIESVVDAMVNDNTGYR